MSELRIGFAITGSFCTFKAVFPQMNLLVEHGYRVIGVDLSEEMLAVADEKCSHLAENRPFFVCQPMQRLRLPEQVDSVICALDRLNYVTRPADVQKTFRRVHDALTPGGLFLFDINTPYKLEGLAGQTFLDEKVGGQAVLGRQT